MICFDKAIEYSGGCTVALGTFDGVHLGHRAVIAAALETGLPTVVVTFAQNPQSVLGAVKKHRIMPPEAADAIFERLGCAGVIRLDFAKIKDMEPRDYLSMLVDRIGARNIVFGYDFRFGKGAAGNAELARAFCEERGIGLHVCEAVVVGGKPVSSTRIRALLEAGDAVAAGELLGEPYAVYGKVVHGSERGRTIGLPTINQRFAEQDVLPKFGVYAASVEIDGGDFPAVANIGIRPTFRLEEAMAETHIIGFSGDLYGRVLAVKLGKYIRPEQKFESLAALKSQIDSDIRHCLLVRAAEGCLSANGAN